MTDAEFKQRCIDNSYGYSAHVEIELHIAGRCIPVSQTGGGQIIFDEPQPLPAGHAELIMHIDLHERPRD